MSVHIIRNNFTIEAWLLHITGTRKRCLKRCCHCFTKWSKSKTTHVHFYIDSDNNGHDCGMSEDIICDDCLSKIDQK